VPNGSADEVLETPAAKATISLTTAEEPPPRRAVQAPRAAWLRQTERQVPWDETLQGEALRLLATPADVLLLGLGTWVGHNWRARLRAQASSVVAVDADAGRLSEWRSVCEVQIQTSLESLAWSQMLIGRRFGAVVVGDALTHQADPLHFLGRVREVLAPDGSLVGIVPNATWGEHRLKLLQGELPRGYEPGSALHRYNPDRLREALALAGYALVELYAHRTPLFESADAITPELFPDQVLEALGPNEDATVSHLVFRAVPASSDDLLRGLFLEQEELKRNVRAELVRARRTCEVMGEQLKAAEARQEALENEAADHRSTIAGIGERAARLEQNVRSLSQERDAAWHELQAVRNAWWYRFLGPLVRRPADVDV
jgi:SAM-dependent methyltransferase